VRQIVFATDALQLYSGNVLKTTAAHENDIVLLKIMTDARHVGDLFLAGRESHEDALTICRVGFTRLLDEDLEDYTFGERLSVEWLALGTIFDVWTFHMHLI
jgi:hypothetical protein